jgi:single-strand DNA-binding protein
MEIKGIIKAIFAEQVISDKFRKREFVLTTNDKYPQDVLFQLTQGNTDLIDTIRVGEEVEVKFNLRGKEYSNREGKISYFNSLEVWQVNVLQTRSTPVAKPKESVIDEAQSNESDLPF